MRQLFLVSFAAVTLSGCASAPTFEELQIMMESQQQDIAGARILLREQGDCCAALSALPYQSLAQGEESKFQISNQTPRFTFNDGTSRFLAFVLPEHRYPLVLEMSSVITDSVFAPTVLLLDETYQVTRRITGDAFEVSSNILFEKDSLNTQQLIMPDERYMVIYSSDRQQEQFTSVEHPAKLYAKARSTMPPAIPDLEFRHAPIGQVQISLSSSQKPQWLQLLLSR